MKPNRIIILKKIREETDIIALFELKAKINNRLLELTEADYRAYALHSAQDENFEMNNLESYEEWLYEEVNCRKKDLEAKERFKPLSQGECFNKMIKGGLI